MYYAEDAQAMNDVNDPGKAAHIKSFRDYHEKTYGPLNEFGYKDFIPMLKLEKFDADYYAELVKKSGATYFAAPAVHHDGFAMWDSEVIDWNAAKMGPKRDVVGELTEAMRSMMVLLQSAGR
jgi:alpha-L-fucosidase